MIASLLALSLASPPLPQDADLYIIGRPSRIWHVTDWNGSNPVYEFLFDLTPPGFDQIWRGLEVDRQTGDLLVLSSALDLEPQSQSYLQRIDKTTGATLESWVIPVPGLSGLEQRSDGALFSLSGNTIVRLDVDAQTTTSTPLSMPLTESNFYGLAMDETGVLMVQAFASLGSDARYSVHPGDGTVTAESTESRSILSLESDGQGQTLLGTVGFGRGVELEDRATGAITMMPGSIVVDRSYALALDQPVDGVGAHPVCSSQINSTGEGATLELTGTTDLTANELEFYSRLLPTSSFGYFLTGPNLGFQAVGSGLLCVGAPQSRYSNFVLDSGSNGFVRFQIDAFNIPSGGAVMPGRTDIFQYWFRDLGSTSNFSEAVAVTWQ